MLLFFFWRKFQTLENYGLYHLYEYICNFKLYNIIKVMELLRNRFVGDSTVIKFRSLDLVWQVSYCSI